MIRTCGPRFRKPVLYPTELRGLSDVCYYNLNYTQNVMAGICGCSQISGSPGSKQLCAVKYEFSIAE